MSEMPDTSASGGALLRSAREQRGLSIESLAAMLKVSPAKLQALESGAHEALPDLAFARALAKTVCRQLGLDPEPVLASLPSAQPVNLAASDPKGVPFKATKARLNLDAHTGWNWQPLLQVRWLVPAGILAAAALLHFWPQGADWGTLGWPVPAASAPELAASVALPEALAERNALASEQAASGEGLPTLAQPSMSLASANASAASSALGLPAAQGPDAASGAQPGVAALPAMAVPSAPLSPVVPMGAVAAVQGTLVLSADEGSWVEVRQLAGGQKVLQRHLQPGETVSLDAPQALTVKIGNANGVRVQYRGQPIELAAFTRNNVARLELK
jgi:cytoskeleton protein RodZ